MRVVFCLLLVAAFFFVPGHLLISKLCKVPAKQQVAAPGNFYSSEKGVLGFLYSKTSLHHLLNILPLGHLPSKNESI